MYIVVLIIILISILAAVWYSVEVMDIFNPMLLFTVPIGVQYTIYLRFYMEQELHWKTLLILGTVVVTFMAGCCLCKVLHKKKFYHRPREKIYFNPTTMHIFILVACVGFILSVVEMFDVGRTGTDHFFINVRTNEIYGSGKSFFTKYSAVFLYMATLTHLYHYLYCVKVLKVRSGRAKRRLFLLCCLLFLSPLFTVARTELLTYVLSISCLVYHFSEKGIHRSVVSFVKKYRSVFLVVCFLIGSFYILGVLSGRSATSDFKSQDFFVYRYMGYTLVTFDSFCIGKSSVNGSLNLLGPVFKVLKLAGIPLEHTSVVPSGVPYNVYGYMGEVYTSVGFTGLIVVTLIIAYLAMLLYVYARLRGGYYLIFYSSYIYTITMSFFAYQYANTFYIYLLILIAVLNVHSNGRIVLKKGKGEMIAAN